ncbi:hypothetical protein ACWF7W_56525, partial [Nonomuraea angiospora]
VRSDGHGGYLFLTTYQPPGRPLDAQKDVQVTVSFEDGDVTVPTRPLDLPAGVSLVWPLRYRLAPGLVLRSATAQLLTRITDEDGDLVVLCATGVVPVELVLDGDVRVDGARSLGDATVVDVAEPGPECVVDLPGARILVLDEASANRLYRLEVAGRERLVLSDAPVYALDGALVLHSEAERCAVALLPAPAALTADAGELAGPHGEG